MATPSIEDGLIIESGGLDDLDGVMVVMESAFGSRFGEAWTRSQCAGILPMAGVALTLARAEAGGAVTGFSLVRSVAGEAELLLIAVAPERHRAGIGAALLDNFLTRSRSAGVGRVHLEVRDGNPAIGMYRSAGFRQAGRRPKYYRSPDGQRFDALTFAREL
jgi:ribosomal-protein-alanine N-acetyltransferase